MLTRPTQTSLPFMVIAAATTLAMTACGGQPAAPEMAPPKVQVATVGEAQINPYQQFIGRVRAVEDVTIYARVSGYLDEYTFQEGQMVNEGDVLFEAGTRRIPNRRRAGRGKIKSSKSRTNRR